MYFTNQSDFYWIVVFFAIGFVMASLIICLSYLSSRLKRVEKMYSSFLLRVVFFISSAISLGVSLVVITILREVSKQGISLPVSSTVALAVGFVSQIAIHYFFSKEDFEKGL